MASESNAAQPLHRSPAKDKRASKQVQAQEWNLHGKSARSRCSKWEKHSKAWDALKTEVKDPTTKPIIFDRVAISDDGGLSDIGHNGDLWYPTRYLSLLVMLAFVFYNVIYILYSDFHVLCTVTPDEVNHYYLLTTWLLETVTYGHLSISYGWSSSLTCLLELILLGLVFCKITVRSVDATVRTGYNRWNSICILLWRLIPDLAYFSAMQLLYFVHTGVLTSQLSYAMFYQVPKKRIPHLLWIFISRPIAFVIGVDCFLIKYRQASPAVNTSDISFGNLLTACLLLNQVLGVVQMKWEISERLFRFIFGGVDGHLTHREEVRMDVWRALVTKTIFEKYSFTQAVALMLTWNDDDVQLLVLEDKTPEDESMHTGSMATMHPKDVGFPEFGS